MCSKKYKAIGCLGEAELKLATFTNARALIVGVADYANINSLPPTITNDARDVAAILMDDQLCGYDPAKVQVLTNVSATADAVRNSLSALAAEMAEDEALFLFFSGHGHRDGAVGAEKSFLLTYDFDFGAPEASSISDSELFAALALIRSRRQVILIDACHAGGMGTLKSPPDQLTPKGIAPAAIDKLASGAGRVVLTSSRSTEYSYALAGATNSVFTDSVLRAMNGAARDKGDGTIGVLDLFDYVSRDVPARQSNQHPVFKADNLEENFSIVAYGVAAGKSAVGVGSSGSLSSSLFVKLYPQGPMENEIWSRAGGDVARLTHGGNAVAQWHRALDMVEKGGGGLTMLALAKAASEDFPERAELTRFINAPR